MPVRAGAVPDTGHQRAATSSSSKTGEDLGDHLGAVDVLVAGSLAVDLLCDYAPRAGDKTMNVTPALHTSNPAIVEQSIGGVGYNVAIAAKYAGCSVLFCSLVGDDLTGHAALAMLRGEGLDTKSIRIMPRGRTAQYIATNDADRDLFVAMADMSIMELPEEALDFEGTWEPMICQSKPRWIVVDGNWSLGVLRKWLDLGKEYACKVAFEPVSTAKSRGLIAAIGPSDSVLSNNNMVSLAAPNKLELAAMHEAARDKGLFESAEWWEIINSMDISSSISRDRLVAVTSLGLVDEGAPQQSIQLLPFIPCIITKLGAQGVLFTQLLGAGDVRLSSAEHAPYILSRGKGLVGGLYMRVFPPAQVIKHNDIVSVNGAGDTLLGVVVAGLALDRTKSIEQLMAIAQEASLESLKSAGGVSSNIARLRELL